MCRWLKLSVSSPKIKVAYDVGLTSRIKYEYQPSISKLSRNWPFKLRYNRRSDSIAIKSLSNVDLAQPKRDNNASAITVDKYDSWVFSLFFSSCPLDLSSRNTNSRSLLPLFAISCPMVLQEATNVNLIAFVHRRRVQPMPRSPKRVIRHWPSEKRRK